jgi:hypothetical protein
VPLSVLDSEGTKSRCGYPARASIAQDLPLILICGW